MPNFLHGLNGHITTVCGKSELRSVCCEDEVSGSEMISTSAAVISCGLYEKELSERHALRRQKNHFRAESENFPITGTAAACRTQSFLREWK